MLYISQIGTLKLYPPPTRSLALSIFHFWSGPCCIFVFLWRSAVPQHCFFFGGPPAQMLPLWVVTQPTFPLSKQLSPSPPDILLTHCLVHNSDIKIFCTFGASLSPASSSLAQSFPLRSPKQKFRTSLLCLISFCQSYLYPGI